MAHHLELGAGTAEAAAVVVAVAALGASPLRPLQLFSPIALLSPGCFHKFRPSGMRKVTNQVGRCVLLFPYLQITHDEFLALCCRPTFPCGSRP